ncbi:MAG: DUF885 domain-containing protein [Gammaproteobacteria bacterium]|nr:DUF885 domain-containing protein [Gammaproteobacteria bacterium]
MTRRIFTVLTILLVISCGGQSNDPASTAVTETASTSALNESDRLNAWFADRNEERLAYSPMELTTLNRKEQYDQLDQFSLEAAQEQLAWHAATIEEMQQAFSYDALDLEAKSSWDTWIYMHERNRGIQEFASQFYLFEQMNGNHSLFPTFMINYHKVDTLSDMQAYIARLRQVDHALGQELEKARSNAERGVRAPMFAYEIVIDEARKIISGVPFGDQVENESAVWADSMAKISALVEAGEVDTAMAETLTDQVRSALLEGYQPIYEEIIAWLSEDIANTDSEPRGVWALPQGEAYYNQLLSFYTTTNLSAEEVHQIGLEEVERLMAEMAVVKEEAGFAGEMLEFLDLVSSDEKFYYSNTDEGRQAYLDDTNAYYDSIREKLPEYFGILPKADLVVKRVEAFREQDGAPAHYNSSSPDGETPGTYYVHMSDMNANPSYEMESTAYHEGLPGHHMQIAIALELETIPEFRRQTFYNAYVEGWALYTERLAWEMGAYEDPYSNLGRLSNEIWRGVRLVVDTGMHAMGWTKEEAINYFAAHSLAPIESIVAEINRYLVIPGQATSYKIGMLKILELRERSQEALGENFDIREFHDVVLSGGALPLDILDRRINNYIEVAQLQ